MLKVVVARCAQLLLRLFGRVTGTLPTDLKGTVVVANHVWLADPFFVGALFYGKTEFVFLASEHLLQQPLLAWFVRTYECITVDRENPSKTSIRDVLRAIGAGKTIIMYPEGKVSRDGRLGDLKKGVVAFVQHAGKFLPIGLAMRSRGMRATRPWQVLAINIGHVQSVNPKGDQAATLAAIREALASLLLPIQA